MDKALLRSCNFQFNSSKGVKYVNKIVDKILTKVINDAYLISGNYQTVLFLDRLKDLGFGMATESGASIAISDVLIPDEKSICKKLK